MRNGAFEITLPPGSYYLAAFDIPDAFYQNRNGEDVAFLESLVAGATKVSLTEGQATTVALRLIAQ